MFPFSPGSLCCWWLPQPRARSDPRACPGVPVPNTALGQPLGISAVPGWWGQGCAHLSSPRGQCWVTPLGAAVFPGTETLLITYPKILNPWSKTTLGVSTAELQFPISAPVPARLEAGGAPYVTCSSQAQMPLQSSEPALQLCVFKGKREAFLLETKRCLGAFHHPHFASSHLQDLLMFGDSSSSP